MGANATEPCPGYERRLYESPWVLVKEVNGVVHQFLRQVDLELVGERDNLEAR
jgi:hypothetical protein